MQAPMPSFPKQMRVNLKVVLTSSQSASAVSATEVTKLLGQIGSHNAQAPGAGKPDEGRRAIYVGVMVQRPTSKVCLARGLAGWGRSR
jgi:hypothetical protein